MKALQITFLFFLLIIGIAGCNKSLIRWQSDKDPSTHYTLRGAAADKYAAALAQNALTEQGRVNALNKYNNLLHLIFVILFVVGIAAGLYGLCSLSGLSKYTWIVPVAAVGGETYIRFWTTDYSTYVAIGVVTVSIGILAYKMIDYRRERDNALQNGQGI